MSKLRPVKSDYMPKYPRRLSDAELQQYMQPGLKRRFSNETMILSTLLVGSTLASCTRTVPIVPGGAQTLPMAGKSTRTDPKLKEKVDQLVAEVMNNQQAGGWFERSKVKYYRLIADNPMVKAPQVNISFGNSISGIFNVEEAKAATMKLFDAYGIPLESGLTVKGDGYGFVADGFNSDLNVGFEIRSTKGPEAHYGAKFSEAQSGAEFLGHEELVAIEQDVNAENIDVFVCDPYLIYGGDDKMAMAYYLASVVDYLNWIHGDRNIDYNQVLGEPREVAAPWKFENHEKRILWKPDSDEKVSANAWTIEKGTLSIEQHGGAWTLMINLEAGASAIYHQPEGPASELVDTPKWVFPRLFMTLVETKPDPVDFDLYLNGDPRTRLRNTFMSGNNGEFDVRPDGEIGEQHRTLQSITITNVNRFPITLRLTRVGAHYY